MKNIDMSTLSPEVAAYIRSLEETCILRSPAAAGAVTNGSPAAAAAAQFLRCSFCWE